MLVLQNFGQLPHESFWRRYLRMCRDGNEPNV
jgi:hypothetical protein